MVLQVVRVVQAHPVVLAHPVYYLLLVMIMNCCLYSLEQHMDILLVLD
jgi:hypothetical protein